ncbi:uncharacterized protein LOC125105629 [Lutra lutra]|uniref:uncharacterized protein LOC125105629 n=1 Tax=Lutra lutra TaxID=9657 RepID=UPI001FD3CC42|nr:uncharacterized protein LOC125105629 [Lutra lutra]
MANARRPPDPQNKATDSVILQFRSFSSLSPTRCQDCAGAQGKEQTGSSWPHCSLGQTKLRSDGKEEIWVGASLAFGPISSDKKKGRRPGSPPSQTVFSPRGTRRPPNKVPWGESQWTIPAVSGNPAEWALDISVTSGPTLSGVPFLESEGRQLAPSEQGLKVPSLVSLGALEARRCLLHGEPVSAQRGQDARLRSGPSRGRNHRSRVLSCRLESNPVHRLSFSRSFESQTPRAIYQGPPCTWDHARHSKNNPGCLQPSYFAEWTPLDPPYCSWAVALDKAWARHCHCQSHGAGGSHPAQWKACLVSGPHLSILRPRHWQGAWWTDSWPRPVSGSAQGYRGWQVNPGLHVDEGKSWLLQRVEVCGPWRKG